MANEQNLKPFQPGQSGNPNGRPEGVKNRATIFKKWLEVSAKITNPETGAAEDGTLEDKLAVKVIAEALKGDIQAAKEVLDSVYGKANQPVTADLNVIWNEVKNYGANDKTNDSD